jgi:TfoX/Sxy family transcriptional regulator of competence genes
VAYDEGLGERVRMILSDRADFGERKMFGGLCFLVGGHMCAGVVKDELMLRVGPERFDKVLARKHARPMDFTGRPMKGMVYVASEGLKTKRQLESWLAPALEFVSALPPKKPKKPKKPKPRKPRANGSARGRVRRS